MSGDLPHWLAVGGLFLAFAAMVYIAARSLFGDKERGTRRCPRCWHNLSETRGLTCGECGHAAQLEKQLFKTRRRWLPALGSIVVCIALAAFVQGRVIQNGWLSFVPTKVLVLTLPMINGPASDAFGEIVSRANQDELSAFEWDMLVNRIVDGDAGARPTSQAWALKYGSLLHAIRGTPFTDEQLDKIMELPPRVDAHTRGITPIDAHPVAHVEVHDWWPRRTEIRVTAQPKIDGVEPYVFRRTGDFRPPPFAMPLRTALPSEAGAHSVDVDFTLERRGDGDEPWTSLGTQTVTITYDTSGTIADRLAFVDEPEHERALRQVFEDGWVAWENGITPVRVNVGRRRTFIPSFDDVAIGARVELKCDGQLARRLEMWWLAGTKAPERNNSWDTVFEDRALLAEVGNPARRWTMHVTGVPALALRAGGGDACWTGSFVVQIMSFDARESDAPDVPWEVERRADDALER